jgi:hypothetical protein
VLSCAGRRPLAPFADLLAADVLGVFLAADVLGVFLAADVLGVFLAADLLGVLLVPAAEVLVDRPADLAGDLVVVLALEDRAAPLADGRVAVLADLLGTEFPRSRLLSVSCPSTQAEQPRPGNAPACRRQNGGRELTIAAVARLVLK